MRKILDVSGTTVHSLDASRGNYAYLVTDATRRILVDTGLPGQGTALLRELQALERPLTDVVITHYDVDHVGNLARVAAQGPVSVWIPEQDAPYILGDTPRPGVKRLIAALVKTEPPDHWSPVRPGDQIGPLTAVASPGHTPGHLAYQGPGFLLVGDAITTRNGKAGPMSAILAWNPSVMRSTAQSLLDGFSGWILPAHGEPLNVAGA